LWVTVNLVYHMWYVWAIWVFSVLFSYFRVASVILSGLFLTGAVYTGHPQLLGMLLVQIICWASVELLEYLSGMEKKPLGMEPSAVVPWILWLCPHLSCIVFGLTKESYVFLFFWDYICGAKLKEPCRLEYLQKHVYAVAPWFILLYFMTSAGFAVGPPQKMYTHSPTHTHTHTHTYTHMHPTAQRMFSSDRHSVFKA